MKILSLLLGALFSLSLQAAVSPQVRKNLLPHQNILRGEGALQGGQAGNGFSILDVQRRSVAKKTERLIIDVGDARSQKLQGSLGYYNVELKKDKKLVISFAQTLNSKLENVGLKERFLKSRYIQNASFQFDPIGQNMNLDLDLKKAVVVRVYALKGAKETGKLVIDMIEDQRR